MQDLLRDLFIEVDNIWDLKVTDQNVLVGSKIRVNSWDVITIKEKDFYHFMIDYVRIDRFTVYWPWLVVISHSLAVTIFVVYEDRNIYGS